MKPSLFNYATKELNQDAFFCWLFSWADEKHKNSDLYKVAKDFIHEIIAEDISIKKIDITQQYKNIDFYIRINDILTICFEDKVNTTIHDDQLKRYNISIREKHPNDKIFFVYLKTDFVFKSERDAVEKHGYNIFDIFRIRSILQNGINNDIYTDFLFYIDEKIKSYTDFEKIRFSKWERNEWLGFCYKLQMDYFDDADIGIWQGRELYFVMYESEYLFEKKVYTSLEIKHSQGNNFGRLSILLHIEDGRLNKYNIRDKIQDQLEQNFAMENVNINNRVGNLVNFITFNDFPFVEKGYINYQKTKEYLINTYDVFTKINYMK